MNDFENNHTSFRIPQQESPQDQMNQVPQSSYGFSILCDEPLWDSNQGWDSTIPDFGSCMERTVLVWCPCLLLMSLSPFYFLYLKRQPYNPIPWTPLSCTKLILTVLLMVVSMTELGYTAWQAQTMPLSEFVAPIVLIITYVIHILMVWFSRMKGDRINGLLWTFWFIMISCGVPQLISTISDIVQKEIDLLGITFLVQYVLTICLFITNWFCDAPSKLQLLSMSQKPCPELSASFPSHYMYWWTMPLVWLGWKRPLVYDDIWDLKLDETAEVVAKQWQRPFNRKLKKTEKSYDTERDGINKVYLYKRLWRMCKGKALVIGVVYFSAELVRFATPQLLSLLIDFITNGNEPPWHGYLYAVGLLLACQFCSVLKNRYFFVAVNFSLKVRSAIMSAVYKKAINLSGSARREYTTGQIVNMMAVDAQVIGDTGFQLYNVIGAPFVILVTMGFLWLKLGPSVLAGLAVLVLLTPVNSYLANKTKECQLACIKLRDKRVKMVSEIIGGIKVLKLYAWEESFAKQVQNVRDEEIEYFRQIAYLQSFSAFVFHVSPFFVSLATFTTYLLVSIDNKLTAELAFVSLSLFNIMKLPIIQMPTVIAQIIQASVALKRIQSFLSAGELDSMAVMSDRSEVSHLVIHRGQFSWEGPDGLPSWTLRDVEMEVKPGKLVAVIGSVGAGKSSLVSALLGEMNKEAGKVIVNGSIAYVSQQPWLQNAVVRDNITWGKPYDDKWYHKVIEACALKPDLEMLDGGDMTEVGEKGINLSGGQKQRISLARAVYRDADVILLDDPLSAVDAHVGKHIFEKVIGPQGLLKSKTRLLVTHAVTFLNQVDEIILVKDGRLVETGTYAQLMERDGDFAQFIVQYISSCDDDDQELLELRSQLGTSSRRDILRQISQISSTGSQTQSIGQSSLTNLRQRSVSECQDDPSRRTKSSKISNQMNISNGNIRENLFQKQFSHSMKGLPNSKNGSQQLYSSMSSLQSAITDVELKTESGYQNDNKVYTMIDEELQETGKVARYVYIVYGKAMGAFFAIVPMISLALGQASIAGSNVWLSIWSSSGETYNVLNETNITYAVEEGDYVIPTEDTEPISREVFLAGYGLFGISQAFFIFCGMLCVMLGSLRAANTLHRTLLDTVIRLPMMFFDTNPSGRIINRFSKEISTLDFNLPNITRSLASCICQVAATLIVIIASTPVAAIAIIPIMAVYYMIQVIYVATARQLKRIESVCKSPIYSHFGETIQGVSVIRAFKKQDEFIQESLSKIDRSMRASSAMVNTNRWVAVHLEVLGNMITFAAAMLGVIARDTISPGVVGLSITYALNITVVLNWLVRIASDLEANIVSVERINEYVQREKEAQWTKDGSIDPTWPQEGLISLTNYQTRYRPGLELVLKGINCTFQPSEKVGIVGRTGAGKSSLTLSIFRLIESAGGSIKIDGTDISDLGLHDLRSRLSIIPQDPVLFNGTLRMNLDPFETKSDEDVWRAIELAHLKEYVKSQPLGLQHVVDEEGSNFSVGQRQLVCLARALLRKSRILVLDEATAAVDLETDDLIQNTIRKEFKDCTVLTIAHRINTIMDYDRVMVLDQGRIAEFDSPQNLLENPESIFYSMAKDAGMA